MGFHMVRRHLGDAAFRKILARFYADFRGRRATFDDFRATAEAVSGKPLAGLFDPWVTRAGAAELALGPATVERDGETWKVTGTVRQVQKDAPFALEVPLAVVTEKGTVRQVVKLDGRRGAVRGPDRFRAPRPRRRPAVRPLPQARPAGDPAVDRPALRRAEAPRRPPRGPLRGGRRGLARAPEGVGDADARPRGEDRRGGQGAPRGPRASGSSGRGTASRRSSRSRTGSRSARARSPPSARRWPSRATRSSSSRATRGTPQGRRLDPRRAPRRAPGPRPQAPPLRQVLVPRLRGDRAGERPEGAVARERLAASRRPAPRGPSRGAAPAARAGDAPRPRRAPSRVLAEPASPRTSARSPPRARRTWPRHRGRERRPRSTSPRR